MPIADTRLKRRAKIVDGVIDLIADGGVEAVQMRDVAQHAGVALATVYNYFASKEDLVAAALNSWQEQVVRRTDPGEPADRDPVRGVLNHLRRSQQAADADPEMTALALQLTISFDPIAKAATDKLLGAWTQVLARLAGVVAPEDLAHVAFALTCVLAGSSIGLLTGRVALAESLDHVEWAARVLLGDLAPRTTTRRDSAASEGRTRETPPQ